MDREQRTPSWLQSAPAVCQRVELGDHKLALRRKIAGRPWILVTSRGATQRGVLGRLAAAKLQPESVVYSDAEITHGCLSATGDGTPLVVAIGGGTAIDRGKTLAMNLAMAGDRDWASRWLATGATPVPGRRLPELIAVPTLPGSGAEATSFATVWIGQRKRSLEHPELRPLHVILDLSLVATAPADLRLVSALDGLTHALEAIWNRNATAASDTMARQALSMFAAHLASLGQGSADANVRQAMEASVLAGSAIELTRTSICHAMSYPFTAELDVPHGLAASFAVVEVSRWVAASHPQRAALVAKGLGCGVSDIADTLDALLSRCGATTRQAAVLPADALNRISGSLVEPSRAANFPTLVNEERARAFVSTALRRLHQ